MTDRPIERYERCRARAEFPLTPQSRAKIASFAVNDVVRLVIDGVLNEQANAAFVTSLGAHAYLLDK